MRHGRGDDAHNAPQSAVPADICDAIRSAARIALVGHVTPDADCFGALGAMALALRKAGKQVFVSMPAGTVSRRLNFLAQLGGLQSSTIDELRSCDLVLVLDTAKASRVNLDGKLDALSGIPVLNIDHHATNIGFGKWNWVDGGRSSTSEMVYEVLQALGFKLTADIATLLYAGIHTDTQGFSLTNTTPRSLAVAHDLAELRVDIPALCERLHRSLTPGEFKLLGIIYTNTRVSDDGRLAWSTADYDEIHGAGCRAADIDDQVNIPRSVEGICVAILFTEGNRGKIRMNFRGEGGVEVLELARKFGGGGHHTAAGAILDGTMQEVTARVLKEARAYVAAS